MDSNHHHSGYEPDALSLSYPANKVVNNISLYILPIISYFLTFVKSFLKNILKIVLDFLLKVWYNVIIHWKFIHCFYLWAGLVHYYVGVDRLFQVATKGHQSYDVGESRA